MALQNHRVSLATPSSDNTVSESALEVNVIFTTVEETLPALRAAGELAHGLNATIKLLVAQVVPYPLPLDCPPVQSDFTARRFRTIVGRQRVETRVQVNL